MTDSRPEDPSFFKLLEAASRDCLAASAIPLQDPRSNIGDACQSADETGQDGTHFARYSPRRRFARGHHRPR